MNNLRRRLNSTFANYFKEVIYGGTDGIVTTFAVVSGFAGATLSVSETTQLTFMVVLLFGLANLFADAASMGLGNFLSVRSEKDRYRITRGKEQELIQQDPAHERKETMGVLQTKGFTYEQAATLADTYKHNEEYWLDFLMHHKQGISDPRKEKEVFTGLTTFLSFVVFGAIPLLPFILQLSDDTAVVFFYSCIGTCIALVLLGLLKWRVIGVPLHRAVTEVVLVGGVAAVIAYFVGTFFAI